MSFLFLKPEKHPRRNPDYTVPPSEAAEFVLHWDVSPGTELHIDLETSGLDWHFPNNGQDIVGIGLASAASLYYLDTTALTSSHWRTLLHKLCKAKLWAFNTVFDGGWLYRKAREVEADHNKLLEALTGCTLTMFRGLANEGILGQTHSLERAMEHCLLWTDLNKHWLKEALLKHKLKKGEMYKLATLEWEQFAYYCATDAEASFRLNAFFINNLKAHDLMHRHAFHLNEEIIQIRELIEQQWHGIKINQTKLANYIAKLKSDISSAEEELRRHPLVKDWVDKFEAELAAEFYKPRQKIKRQWAKKADQPWLHPNDWKRKELASESSKGAAWEKQHGCRFYKELVIDVPRNVGKPAPRFNIQSGQHLAQLIYGHLFKYEIDNAAKTVTVFVGTRSVVLNLTDSGELPVGKEMYQVIGPVGKIIGTYNRKEKELGYATTLQEKSSVDGRVHPQFKPHGTMTGRLSATGKLNLQQYPKIEDCLGVFEADEGYVIIDIDFASLEPVVQTEFSKDKSLRELYLAEKPHDIYLWWAQYIHPDPKVKAELQREYPIAWKAGKIEEFKEKYKGPRSLIKTPVLAFSYSMGPKKLYGQWRRLGYDITMEDAKRVYYSYWEKLATFKAWGDKLRAEVESRGGWMLNGFGFPFAIPEMRMKDCPNTFVQSTGHAVLMVFNKRVVRLIKERGIKTHKPFIQDFHDERVSQVALHEAEAYTQILIDAMAATNAELKPDILFKGSPAQGRTLWEVKK